MKLFIFPFRARLFLLLGGILSCLLLLAPAAYAASYTWVGTGGNTNWSNNANWEPVRNTAPDDVLIFDGSRTATAVITVDFASPQTIGQLRFINGIVAVLTVQPVATATVDVPAKRLIISGNLPGADFEITAGCSVQVRSPDGQGSTAGIAFQLEADKTALIAGTLIFGSNSTVASTNDPHRLLAGANQINSIVFDGTGVFKAEREFTGEAFGKTASLRNTVVFRRGATYEQWGGGSPFGVNAPNTVTTFEKGSYYMFAAAGNTGPPGPQLSGRTYGFLEYNRVSTGVTGGTSAISINSLTLNILNDLIVTTGNVRLNVDSVNIQGNVKLNGGTLVNPLGASTVTLNGTVRQAITSTAAAPVLFGAGVTLIVDNLAGVTLETPVQVSKALTLTKGKLTTTAAGPLTLAAGATISANENSYVVGPLTRVVAANGTTSLDFPIGSATAYRPLTLTVNHADAAEARYTAEQVKRKPTARTFTGDIKKVSAVRYFNVTRPAGASNFIDGAIQLSYGADDEVDAPATLRIAKSSADDKCWVSLGGTGSGVPAGVSASSIPFTSFGSFVLASTAAESASGNNPLPVELISLSAQYRTAGVLVQWATASEKDNVGFEVERSIDGRIFAVVGKVKGQGQSSQKHSYSAWDTPPVQESTIYYRLRQLNFDGSATYSGIVAAKGEIQNELYPNPTCNRLTFRSEALGKYRIVAATGQVVRQGQTMTGGFVTLDVAALPAGLYYLETNSIKGQVKRKFVKQAE